MRTARALWLVGMAILALRAPAGAQDHPPLPPARSIPGITAADPHPSGCVDCHVADPARNMDVRFATLFRLWKERPDPAFLARMQPLAPPGVTLTGAHPSAAFSLADVPNGCRACHAGDSKKAPPLAPMVHTIHLTGGDANVFLTVYQGECTHCHKFDPAVGMWQVASGPER